MHNHSTIQGTIKNKNKQRNNEGKAFYSASNVNVAKLIEKLKNQFTINMTQVENFINLATDLFSRDDS